MLDWLGKLVGECGSHEVNRGSIRGLDYYLTIIILFFIYFILFKFENFI